MFPRDFIKDKKILSLDLEANGRKDVVITEIGMITYVNDLVVDKFETLFSDADDISSYVQKLNGITLDKIKDAPKLEEHRKEIQKKIDEADIILLHARDYDSRALFRSGIYLHDAWIFDTHRFAEVLEAGLPLKLEKLGKLAGVENTGSHRALDDAKTTYEVFKYLIEDHSLAKYRKALDENDRYRDIKRNGYLFKFDLDLEVVNK